MSDDVATTFGQFPNVNPIFALAVYILIPVFPLAFGTWWIRRSRQYVWRGGRVKKFFCYLSTLVYEYAPVIALGNLFLATIILLNQGSFYYNNLHVSQEVDYYLKVDSSPFDRTDAYQSALSINSVNLVAEKLGDGDGSRRALQRRQMQDGAADILTLVYHTSSWENLLKEDELFYTCLTERGIIDNVGCLDASDYQSMVPLVFNATTCEYLTSYEESLPLFGLSDNAIFRADSTVYDSKQSSVLVSYFRLGRCDEDSLGSFESNLNKQQVEDIKVTHVSSHFIREEMADANDAALSATLWAVLWGWLVMVFSTRGLVTASTVIYCVLFSVTNAAVMLDSLDYERVSAFNCVGVMVLLAVGISYVTLFGSAFREQVRKGINASHLTTLEVYLTVSQGILLTTLACCLAFFAMATSNVVFVSQLGYFLGVSMVLFYLNLHYIIIPMFLFTSWYALPRSWHMRVKMLRRHYMENCCASCVREAEHTAVEMVHHQHQHGDERSSQSSEGSHSVLLDDESKSDRDSQPEHDDARHVQAHAHARTHAVGAGDDDEAATVVTADHVRFASPGHESAAAHAVVAVPAGTVSGAPPVVEAAHPLELQVLQHSGDSGDEAGRSASRDAAGASDGGETRPAEGADVSAGGAGEGATGGGAGRSQGQETRPAGTLTRIRSLFSSRSNAAPAPTPSPNPAPATGDEHSVSSSSSSAAASSKSEGRHMLAGRRPLKIYGFFVLCVTVAAFIVSYIMSLRVYSIDYSFPQFLSSNSNLGEAVDAFLHYKSDVFATVYNKNDAVFAQATRLNAVGLNDVVNLEVRRRRRAQMKPALTPTPAASLAAAIGHSNATATGVGVEGVHKEEEDNRRALGSSSDYTDYTVLTCWGITKDKSGRDGDVTAEFQIAEFRDYLEDGIEKDLQGLCEYVDGHRGSLDVHPEWEVKRDCIYAQLAAAANSSVVRAVNPADTDVPYPWGVAIGYWATQSYTAGNMVGLLSQDEFDQATPVWLCANFTLRTDEHRLTDDPVHGKNLRQRWIEALQKHGSARADKNGVNSFVFGYDFSYPLLGVQVQRTVQYVGVVFITGFFVFLWAFTLSDMGLTIFGALGIFTIFAICVCLSLHLFNTTISLFDVVALMVLLPLLVNLPVHLIEEYIAARAHSERRDKQLRGYGEEEDDDDGFLSPALSRTLRYSRPALLHPTAIAVVVALPFMFADVPFLRVSGEHTILIALAAYVFTVLIQPYLLAFGCKTNLLDTYCSYYDDDYYEDNYSPPTDSGSGHPPRSSSPDLDPRLFQDSDPYPPTSSYPSSFPPPRSAPPARQGSSFTRTASGGGPVRVSSLNSTQSAAMSDFCDGNSVATGATGYNSEQQSLYYDEASGAYYSPEYPPSVYNERRESYHPQSHSRARGGPGGGSAFGSAYNDDDSSSYYTTDSRQHPQQRQPGYFGPPSRQPSAASTSSHYLAGVGVGGGGRSVGVAPAAPAPSYYEDPYYGGIGGVAVGGNIRASGGSPYMARQSSHRFPAPSQPMPAPAPAGYYGGDHRGGYRDPDDVSYSQYGAGDGAGAHYAGDNRSYAGSVTGSYAGDGYDSGYEGRGPGAGGSVGGGAGYPPHPHGGTGGGSNTRLIYLPRNNSNGSFVSLGPPTPYTEAPLGPGPAPPRHAAGYYEYDQRAAPPPPHQPQARHPANRGPPPPYPGQGQGGYYQ